MRGAQRQDINDFDEWTNHGVAIYDAHHVDRMNCWAMEINMNISSSLFIFIEKHTSSRIVTSIILWLKYAGLFFTTFTATISCVFMFWHFTTWPNVPWPRISRMRYRLWTVQYTADNVWYQRTCDHLRFPANHWHREYNRNPHCRNLHCGRAYSAWWAPSADCAQIRIWTAGCRCDTSRGCW